MSNTKKRQCSWVLAVFVAVSSFGCSAYSADTHLIIDGSVSDWPARTLIAEDPVGDAEGAFDVTAVWASISGTTVYLRVDTTKQLNLQSGPAEDGTLQVVLGLPDDERLVVDTRQRKAYLASEPGTRLPWSKLRFTALPTHAAQHYEMRIDLSALGLEPGDEITVDLDGSDRLEEPAKLVLGGHVRIPVDPTPLSRAEGSDLRVASLNTLRRGLVDPNRSPALGRLLKAAKADVVCLQEEYRREGIQEALVSMLGGNWHLVHHDGCVVASRFPLTPLKLDIGRGVAAAIELPEVGPVVVISIHMKCCGYAGSTEDQTRIDEATALAAAVVHLRSGQLGPVYRNAPIVIAGDYNLVGSRRPLRLLEAAGLAEVLPIRTGVGDAVTWRGLKPDESFWPGRLDLMMHGPNVEAVKAVIVDTAVLGDAALEASGLQRADSEASDHLMLVLDLAAVGGGD